LYAIIETGGKQYRVEEGNVLKVEKLNAAEGETVELDRVLALKKDDQLTVGAPWVAGVKVLAQVLEHGRGKKIIVFKYKPKKNYRRKQGHRQSFTKLRIEKIEG
jgi:large subunit ribosomal protein L21